MERKEEPREREQRLREQIDESRRRLAMTPREERRQLLEQIEERKEREQRLREQIDESRRRLAMTPREERRRLLEQIEERLSVQSVRRLRERIDESLRELAMMTIEERRQLLERIEQQLGVQGVSRILERIDESLRQLAMSPIEEHEERRQILEQIKRDERLLVQLILRSGRQILEQMQRLGRMEGKEDPDQQAEPFLQEDEQLAEPLFDLPDDFHLEELLQYIHPENLMIGAFLLYGYVVLNILNLTKSLGRILVKERRMFIVFSTVLNFININRLLYEDEYNNLEPLLMFLNVFLIFVGGIIEIGVQFGLEPGAGAGAAAGAGAGAGAGGNVEHRLLRHVAVNRQRQDAVNLGAGAGAGGNVEHRLLRHVAVNRQRQDAVNLGAAAGAGAGARETKIDPSQYGEEDICPICRVGFNEGGTLLTNSCGHQFHKECITQWFQQSNSRSCPMCRSNVESPKRRGSPKRKSACHSKKSQNCKKSPRCTWTKGYKNVVSGKPVKGLCRRKKSPGRK